MLIPTLLYVVDLHKDTDFSKGRKIIEGAASPQAVDEVMKLGMNHPMGPLTLADFIGLDTCLHIMEVLREGQRIRNSVLDLFVEIM